MQTLSALNDESLVIEEEEKRHGRRLLVGILCALLLSGGLLGGYLYLRKRHQSQLAATAEAAKRKAVAPRLEVFVDDAMPNGKTTLIGGQLHNISNEALHNVAVEFELTRRIRGSVEKKLIVPEQSELAPAATARYGVELPVQDYVSAKLARIVSGDNHAEVPFKALQGARRPPMEPPTAKTVIVNRPRARGEEFINSPDKPARVP